jgi:hypothetical protein
MALENISAGSEEALSNDLSQFNLDLSGAESPLDSFSGLNLNSLETDDNVVNKLNTTDSPAEVTSDQSGPGPGNTPPAKKKLSMAEMQALHRKNLLKTEIYSKNLGAIAAQSMNQFEASKEYEFDTYKSNVERYEAYGKKTFNSLGFNPFEDNEAHYNANTGSWQEWKRMMGQFGALHSSAFYSNYRSVGRMLKGDNLISPDDEGDREFAEANRIGASTKGGLTGFATNLALNSAYSIGIATNVMMEEAVIWGLGILAAAPTSGGSLVASAAVQGAEAVSIASKLSRLKRATSLAFGGSELANIGRGSLQMLKGLSRADDAKMFYQGFRTFGKGAVNFINPFRQTTAALKGIARGGEGYRNLSNAAKMSRSFGSFYRDMRENWFSIGEAQLEGAGVMDKRLNENIDAYLKDPKNGGQLPTGEALDKAYANAYAASRVDIMGNIPLIFITNRVTFDSLFKFKGIGKLVDVFEKGGAKMGKEFAFSLADKSIVDAGKKGFFKGAWAAIKNPKMYAGGFLHYTKENFMEGIQELGQEWLSDSTNRYYKRMYSDQSIAQADLLKTGLFGSLLDTVSSKESWDAAKSQVFSGQGLHTFLSGFVMGGFIGGPKASITGLANKTFSGLADFYLKKTKSPEEYAQYKLQKATLREQHKAVLNTILSGAENFFSPKKESLYYQKKVASNLVTAEDNKDDKAFYDAKDEAMFDHIMTSLNAETFDTIIDSFDQLDKLSESELADYFNLEKGDKAKEKLQEYKSRAKEIKKRYDFFQDKFGNPFNPKRYTPGSEEHITEFIAHKAFEDAKKAAIASQYGFDRSVERMQNIYDDISREKPIAKSSESDYSVLFNPNTMASEIKLLKQEAEMLSQSTDKDERKIGKQKLKKAEALEDYLEKYNEYTTKKSKPIKNDDGTFTVPYEAELMDPLRKSYGKYLGVIANNNDDYLFNDNIDSSFEKIMDYYGLDADSKKYMEAVNHLSNPNNLLRHAETIRQTLRQLYDNRNQVVDDALDNYFNVRQFNELIVAMGKIGVVIDPEQLLSLAKDGKTPTDFFDISSGKAIADDDVRMDRIKQILETYKTITEDIDNVKPEVVVEEEEEDVPEVKPEVVQPTVVKKEKLATEVEDKLKQAYDAFIEDTGSSMTYDDFVETHPTAARIKAGGVSAAPVVQPAATTDTEQQKQKVLEDKVKELTNERNKLRSADGSVPADKMDEFNRLGKEINEAKLATARGNSTSSMLIKMFPKGVDKTTADPEALSAEAKKEAADIIEQVIQNSKTAEEAFKKIQRLEYIFDINITQLLKRYLDDRFNPNAPRTGNNKDSFQAWIYGKTDAEVGAQQTTPTQAAPVAPTVNIEAEKAKLEERRKEKLDAFSLQSNIIAAAFQANSSLFTLKNDGTNDYNYPKEITHNGVTFKLGSTFNNHFTVTNTKTGFESKFTHTAIYNITRSDQRKNAQQEVDKELAKIESEYNTGLAALGVKPAQVAEVKPEIILGGLNMGYKGEGFDVRSGVGVHRELELENSFAKVIERDGKKYVVVGLRLQTARPANTVGRDNYSFATAELNETTPKNIVEILEKAAKENFKNIYPDFNSRDVTKPISTKDAELKALEVTTETKEEEGYYGKPVEGEVIIPIQNGTMTFVLANREDYQEEFIYDVKDGQVVKGTHHVNYVYSKKENYNGGLKDEERYSDIPEPLEQFRRQMLYDGGKLRDKFIFEEKPITGQGGKPAQTKNTSIQPSPENIGANTDVVVVDDQSERPDVFDEWTDPQIIASGVQPLLVAKQIQDIYDLGQKLDKENASWSIGSFRAQVDGRLIVDVFAGGKHFLMYKSTGEGTGAASKGEWVPIFGFAQNGWFIKDMWKGQNPKFTKYESETFKSIDRWLKDNSDPLFDGPPLNSQQQAQQKTAEQKIGDVLNEVKSIKDVPDEKLNSTNDATNKLMKLITSGEVTSDQVLDAVKAKIEEVMKNIQPSDFIKGDVVIFKDGTKGIVDSVNKDTLVMKMFNDPPGLYRTLEAKDLKNTASVKSSKEAIEEEKDTKIEVTPEDKQSITESKETATNLVDDSTRSKQIIDQAAQEAKTSTEATFDDLLGEVGCDI